MWQWIKEHPIIVVGGIGALVVLYLLIGSSSTSSTTTTTAYPQPTDAEVNAAAAIQGAQIQASTSEAENATQTGAAVQVAQLQAGETTAQYNAELSANNSNNATALAITRSNNRAANVQAGMAATVQTAGINATESVQNAGIASQTAIGLANLATQAQLASISSATTLGVTSSNNAAFVDLAAINAASHAPGTSIDYGSSVSGLESAISSTGSVGQGLLSEVKTASAGGVNQTTWGAITNLVQNWASRTTAKSNQPAKNTILGALNNPTYGAPAPSAYITNLLPV